MMVELKLKRGKEESLIRQHPWIFSGAIASASGAVEDGDMVNVISSEDRFLARGISATGSIAVRVLTFKDEKIDQQWWCKKIGNALSVRRAMNLVDNPETNCYRLINGEGDSLPGLVVDIYGSTAVVQAHAAGIYLMRHEIAAALMDTVGVRAVYDKSGSTIPFQSGIEVHEGYIAGTKVEGERLLESGLTLLAAWEGGQKTGLFIDQRINRQLVGRYAAGRRVLNTFCYTGGFSLAAIKGGALSVDSVDSSARAIELCAANIAQNFPINQSHNEITADALNYIRDMPANKYDLIVLDPPAFAKHRQASAAALKAYRRLNESAIKKCAPGSIIFTFSCSQAVSREQFRMAVFSGAALAGREVRILHFLSQGPDHPVNIYHPEGEYLKGLVLFVE
ncbi:MAG: class I SAM-dependent rRNA methyltransferase [Mucinivorans sp.]